MPRPEIPLIKKDDVAALALRIIDEEGIDALSVRRLGAELGVNNKSLYYHFADKQAIVAAAAERALSAMTIPEELGDPWAEWLLATAAAYRDGLLAHPALIPVMLARGRFGFGLAWFDETLARLEAQGLPAPATMALCEALDSFAVGNVLCKTSARTGAPRASELEESFPSLARGLSHRTLGYDDQFRIGCRALIGDVARSFNLKPRFRSTPAEVKK